MAICLHYDDWRRIRRVQKKREKANMNSYTFTNGFHGFLASLINFVHNFVPSWCLGSLSMPMHECKQSKRNGRKSVKPISDHSKTEADPNESKSDQ